MRYFKAFHGTNINSYNQIEKFREFEFIESVDHWLSQGVYFFIEDRGSAEWWSTDVKKIENPCIIEAEININDKELLDFDINEKINEYYTFIRKLDASIKEENMFILLDEKQKKQFDEKLNKEKNKIRRKEIIEGTHRNITISRYVNFLAMRKNLHIKAIKYTFHKNYNNDYYSLIKMPNNQVQLCIKDQSIIDFDSLKCDKI